MPLAMRDAFVLVVERARRRPPGRRSPPARPSCRAGSRRSAWARRRSRVSGFSGRSPPATISPPSSRPDCDVALDAVAVRGGDHRADDGVGLERVADLQHVRHLREAFDDLVVDACAARSRGSARCRSGRSGTSTPSRSSATAVFRSASSNTSAAPLPPSSSSRRFIVRPPTSPMRMPDAGRAGEGHHVDVAATRRAPRPSPGVEPVTTLTTPGGKPDLVQDLARAR